MKRTCFAILTESHRPEWKRALAIAAGVAADQPSSGEPETIKLGLAEHLVLFIREDGVADLASLTGESVDRWRREKNYIAVHALYDFIDNADDRRSLQERVEALVNFRHISQVSDYKNFMDALDRVLDVLEGGGDASAAEAGCEELEKAILQLLGQTRVNRVSVLKHKIANCFLPIDIDLQGWRDTGFNGDYGSEIVTAYKERPFAPLQQVREHLYDGPFSLKNILLQEGEHAAAAEKEIEELLPKAGPAIGKDARAKAFTQASVVLDCLHAGDLEGLQEMIADSDCFHAWFDMLMETLDRLRDAVRNE